MFSFMQNYLIVLSTVYLFRALPRVKHTQLTHLESEKINLT